MPALLLFNGSGLAQAVDAGRATAQEPPVTVLFSPVAGQPDAMLEQFGLEDSELLFGGQDDLAPVYRAHVSQAGVLAMRASGQFKYVELDSPVMAAQVTTDDPYFTTDKLDDDRQWYLENIRLPDAWEYGTGSADVTVAVIDTGIHASHLELNDGRVLAGFDATNNTTIPANSNSDGNGHGTAVAGVIGAIANNGMGVSGVAWDVSLMPIRALQPNGSGVVSDVAKSIIWAAENGADIINLSLGGPGFGNDQTLNNAIIYAYNRGLVIVSAAGNDLADHGINLDTEPVYPVCADGGSNMVIGVVATDVDDKKANFSNYGRTCVDIAAPGKKILTTAYLPSDPANNVLIYGSGTSLAAPLVSGVAALIKSNNPAFTNTQIKNLILRTTDNIDTQNTQSCLGTSCYGFLGNGRLNAYSAVAPRPLLDGDLIRRRSNGDIYLISGGRKLYVSDFVFKQRGYMDSMVIAENGNELSRVPAGKPVWPLKGTLMRTAADPTVYYMADESKHAVTYEVFTARGWNFRDVQIIDKNDLDDIPTGSWYWPPDGTMVMVGNDPTVYVLEDNVKRPVTYFVFTQRGLSFDDVMRIDESRFGHIPRPPDPYWLSPLDGILVKADNDPAVYYIEDGARKIISHDVFVSSKFSYSNIKVLPKAEIQVIRPGKPYKSN